MEHLMNIEEHLVMTLLISVNVYVYRPRSPEAAVKPDSKHQEPSPHSI